jgi:ribosomal protein S18 acetylase RimI-like enzyme
MYVDPTARGGRRAPLLAALVAHAREQGMTRLLLETGTEQPEAVGLYESEGWTSGARLRPLRPRPADALLRPRPPVSGGCARRRATQERACRALLERAR